MIMYTINISKKATMWANIVCTAFGVVFFAAIFLTSGCDQEKSTGFANEQMVVTMVGNQTGQVVDTMANINPLRIRFYNEKKGFYTETLNSMEIRHIGKTNTVTKIEKE